MQSNETERKPKTKTATTSNVTEKVDPQISLIGDLHRKLAIVEAALERYADSSNWLPTHDETGAEVWYFAWQHYDTAPYECGKKALAKIAPASEAGA